MAVNSNQMATFAIGVILLVVFGYVAINAIVTQAPTVNNLTSTATGSPLALSGAGSGTTPGLIYSLMPILWALLPVAVAIGLAKKLGIL